MKALIIAAGQGLRLSLEERRSPKPLSRLLGLTLIERVILTAKEAGIKEFVITVGFQAERVKNFLGDGRRLRVKIDYIHNPNWENGNGHSVLLAKEKLGQRSFILLMADHIFSPTILYPLLNCSPNNGACTLVVNKKLDTVYSIDQETKVRIDNGYVQAIGRDLNDFDAIDTGIFRCSPIIFDALRASIARGDDTVSGAISVLAEQGLCTVVEMNEGFCLNINTKGALHFAKTKLLKSLTKPTDGIIAKLLNRRISLIITRLLVKTKIRPNAITTFSFLLGVVSGGLFLLRHPLLGGVFAQISSIVDGIDGEVARLKFAKSPFGAVLDMVFDRLADVFIILSIALFSFINNHNPIIWVVFPFALAGSFISMVFKVRYRSLTGKDYDETLDGFWQWLPASRDGRLFIIMVGGIANQPILTLGLLAIVTHLKMVIRLLHLRTLLRGIRSHKPSRIGIID